MSLVFLRRHPDRIQAIEEAQRARPASPSTSMAADKAKEQDIAALHRRLEDMKQQLAAKDRELRQKQRELDRLYGKLAAATPLTDVELRCALTDALGRLAQQEMHAAEMN